MQEADQAAGFCFPDQLARIYIYYLSPKGISFRDYCNKKNWGITLEIPLAGFLSINFWHESNQRFFGMTKKVSCSRMQDVYWMSLPQVI
jgi:hypothetical protein